MRQADKPPSLDSFGRMENNNPSLLSFLLPDGFPDPIRYADWASRSSVRTTSRIPTSIIKNSFALFLRTASQRLLEWLSWLRDGLLQFLPSRRRAISRNLRSEVQASLDRLSGPKCPSLPPLSRCTPAQGATDQISFNLLPALASSPRETPKNAAATARGNLMAKLGP